MTILRSLIERFTALRQVANLLPRNSSGVLIPFLVGNTKPASERGKRPMTILSGKPWEIALATTAEIGYAKCIDVVGDKLSSCTRPLPIMDLHINSDIRVIVLGHSKVEWGVIADR